MPFNWRDDGGRRRTERFPVERKVVYKTLGGADERITGIGRTVNMSSGGVLFTVQHPLDVGQLLELSISWPAKLDGELPLKLVVVGSVVRYGLREVAIEIQQYDFHINPKPATQARANFRESAPEMRKKIAG